MGVGLTVYIVL